MAPGRSELWVPISYQPTSLHVAQPLLRSWYGLRLLQLTSNFDNPTCVIRLWDSLVNSIKQPSSLNEKFHAAADPTWLCFVQILFADCCILHSSSRHKHTQLRLHSNIFFFFLLVFTPAVHDEYLQSHTQYTICFACFLSATKYKSFGSSANILSPNSLLSES